MKKTKIVEERFVAVTFTCCRNGWTNVEANGTCTRIWSWKYRIPDGFAEVDSKWYIKRTRYIKKWSGWSKVNDVTNEVTSVEIDAHILLCRPWPQRVLDAWANAKLI